MFPIKGARINPGGAAVEDTFVICGPCGAKDVFEDVEAEAGGTGAGSGAAGRYFSS